MMRFLILFCLPLLAYGQEDLFVGQTRFMQKINPSYFGFNNLNRVGILYNSMSVNNQQSEIDNNYIFGAFSFDNLNFSLGIDINSFQVRNTGFSNTSLNLTYVYKIQVSDGLFFLPAVRIGLGNSSVNASELIFEDQLNTTGTINTESIDPIVNEGLAATYMDLGASFLVHSELFLAGLSFRNLNQPNVSYNNGEVSKKDISITLNGGYEFDINPYNRGILPDFSYLLAYGSITKLGSSFYTYFSQELQLGSLSIGLNELASSVDSFNLNNVGASFGLSVENFDFGIVYNLPFRNISKVYSPRTLEFYVTFDFSQFRRNRRGLFKRLQTDNYF